MPRKPAHKPSPADRELSPALELILHVRRHQGHQQGRSNDRRDHALADAVMFAIKYGLRFDLDDFEKLSETDGYHDRGFMPIGGYIEQYYSVACGSERGHTNKSAALAFEQWRRRKPFIVRHDPRLQTADRLYVGCQFEWFGRTVTCTSFNDEKGTATACTYKSVEGDLFQREKIDKRFTIEHDDIRYYHASITAWDELTTLLNAAAPEVRQQMATWAKNRFAECKRRNYSLTAKEVDECRAQLAKFTAASPTPTSEIAHPTSAEAHP